MVTMNIQVMETAVKEAEQKAQKLQKENPELSAFHEGRVTAYNTAIALLKTSIEVSEV
jgi:hypothetical protein